MTQPWTPPSGDTWVDVTLKKRIGNPGGALTFAEGDLNKSDAENAINWLGNRVMELFANQWQSGDMKITYNSTVPVGWLLVTNSTIGNTSSGSTYTGNTYFSLYSVVWASATNNDLLTSAGGVTTKGGTALADWNANKRLYLPDVAGRSISAYGVSRSGITSRTLNEKYGAESVTYTPQGTVSQASVAGITATCGAISVSGITVSTATATSSAISIGSLTATLGAISIGSLTATCSAINIGSLTSSVTLANGALTGTGNVSVSGAVCHDVKDGTEQPISVIECSSVLRVSVVDIASQLTSNVTVSSATIGGSIPTPTITMGGSIPSPAITIGGSIPTPTITVNPQTIGGSIASPTITIGGSIAAQTFSGTQATINTLPPTVTTYVIIKV